MVNWRYRLADLLAGAVIGVVVAIAHHYLVPQSWSLIAGAVAGMAAGMGAQMMVSVFLGSIFGSMEIMLPGMFVGMLGMLPPLFSMNSVRVEIFLGGVLGFLIFLTFEMWDLRLQGTLLKVQKSPSAQQKHKVPHLCWNGPPWLCDALEKTGDRRRAAFQMRLFGKMNGKVLFAAAGTGLNFAHFPPGKEIVAIDLSSQMLEKARTRAACYQGSLSLQEADVERLPFADESFDTAASASTFCSVGDPLAGLREFHRVLKPGGALLLFEHVRSRNAPTALMLDLLNVLMRWLGPEMNRDTVGNVERAGFVVDRIVCAYLDVFLAIEGHKPAIADSHNARLIPETRRGKVLPLSSFRQGTEMDIHSCCESAAIVKPLPSLLPSDRIRPLPLTASVCQPTGKTPGVPPGAEPQLQEPELPAKSDDASLERILQGVSSQGRLFLLALVLIAILPRPAVAQVPDAQNDLVASWRARFSESLDQSIVRLRAESTAAAPAAGPAEYPSQPLARSPFRAPEKEPEAMRAAVESILREEGLPAGFSGIAAIESSYRPLAVSPKGAAGIWQLMPETARRYGLLVARGRDERFDPQKSTIAAARYLKDLYRQFEDWPLAFAAYNTGEDRIERLLRRVHTRDFWTLSRLAALPEETRRYVPTVLHAVGESRCRFFAGSFSARGCALSVEPTLRLTIGARAGTRLFYASPSPAPEPMASGSGGS
jgi:SAM-dependent methyltransferase